MIFDNDNETKDLDRNMIEEFGNDKPAKAIPFKLVIAKSQFAMLKQQGIALIEEEFHII